ncbi:GPI mannosyltransferase [Apiospora phragmitis]|uniref:Mannosyltransferase n=1 Tax=Apiospora phragmitis TaxID=2905665 RepID=A0ABR1TR95_9PEZI
MTATEDSSADVAGATQASPKDAASSGAACPVTDSRRAQQVRDALSVLFGFRLLNALCLRTFFQPDEYFQALEPAWRIAFGADSGPWMTWVGFPRDGLEWQYNLRSSLHPGLFSLGYTLIAGYMSSMRLSPHYTGIALVAAPKVIQAGIAALTDWYAWRLAEKLYGGNSAAAWSVLLMSIANPWVWYVSTRTFSNTMEAALTIAALYYFPWDLLGVEKKVKEKDRPVVFGTTGAVNRQATTSKMLWHDYKLTCEPFYSLRLSIILAALAVILRPTNILIWAAIGIVVLTGFTAEGESPLDTWTCLIIIREVLLCGSLVLGLSLVADYQLYGEWTFPPFNFFYFNIGQALAVFYGQNDGHYYLSQGIPLSFTTIAPFAVMGMFNAASESFSGSLMTKNTRKALGFASTAMTSALSLISHKEVRFLYPLVPVLHVLAAPHITSFFTTITAGGIPSSSGPVGIKRKGILVAGLFINLIIGSYLSYFHAAAPIQVMDYLRGEFERVHPGNATLVEPYGKYNATSEPLELFALFLTPCHTTPWRSHLVYPALWARELTCEPPLHTEPGSPERQAYVDEGWRFERDKIGFMSTELWPSEGGEEIPRYIIGFEGIEDALMEYFGSNGPGANKGVKLTKTWAQWNGLFTDDDRKAGELRVWDTNSYSAATNGPA